MPRKTKCDHLLLFITLVLSGIGVTMIYSSSAIIALEDYNDPFYFLKKQVLFISIGLVLMLVATHIDYHYLRKLTIPILGISFLMLIAVLIPGLGIEKNGAKRWLNIGGIIFQPSEFAKFSVILYTAYSISKRKEKLRELYTGQLPVFQGSFLSRKSLKVHNGILNCPPME